MVVGGGGNDKEVSGEERKWVVFVSSLLCSLLPSLLCSLPSLPSLSHTHPLHSSSTMLHQTHGTVSSHTRHHMCLHSHPLASHSTPHSAVRQTLAPPSSSTVEEKESDTHPSLGWSSRCCSPECHPPLSTENDDSTPRLHLLVTTLNTLSHQYHHIRHTHHSQHADVVVCQELQLVPIFVFVCQ